MREPTADECSKNAKFEGGRALWFPQMGGYVGKAVAVRDNTGCFDVYVWHDGNLPFSTVDSDAGNYAANPVLLHICDPDQFIRFAETLKEQA